MRYTVWLKIWMTTETGFNSNWGIHQTLDHMLVLNSCETAALIDNGNIVDINSRPEQREIVQRVHTQFYAHFLCSENLPVLLSMSLSDGWWTGLEFSSASPLRTWLRAGLQELEGTWQSTPLEAEQDPDLGRRSTPFTELEREEKSLILP